MEQAVRLGLARSIGISNFNVRQIEDILLRATIRPAVVQVESHPLLANREVIEWCQDRNIAITAYSPLGNPGSQLAPKFVFFLANFKPQALIYFCFDRDVEKLSKWPNLINDPRLTAIAAKYPGKSTAQVMLRWQLQRGKKRPHPSKNLPKCIVFFLFPSGVAVIPKSAHENRIRSNFEVFDFELSRDDMEAIYAIDAGVRTCPFAFAGNSSSRDYPFDEYRDTDPW